MTLPIGEIGASALSGGAVVGFLMKVLPILLRKISGKKINNSNCKPGKADVCIKQGKKLVLHDAAIVHLCGSIVRIDKQMETAHKEDREDHQLMFAKLDKLRK